MDPATAKFSFIDPHTLNNFSVEEKKQLALKFQKQGENLLEIDEESAYEYFLQASECDPTSIEILLAQGSALYRYGSKNGSKKSLLIAAKKFRSSTHLNLQNFNAWHGWGIALLQLGQLCDQYHYFLEAKEKLIKALNYSHSQTSTVLAHLYWDCAVLWSHIAMQAQEALDYNTSLDFFKKSVETHEPLSSDFWSGYGKTYLGIYSRIANPTLITKAIDCFEKSLVLNRSYSNELNLALTRELLFNINQDEESFRLAYQSFVSTSELHPNESEIWLKWGCFLFKAGLIMQHSKRLKLANEKFKIAHQLGLNSATLYAAWAKNLALLGQFENRLELIHKAQNMADKAADMVYNTALDAIQASGDCLVALGYYYDDFDYFYQAIEKYQEGLTLDRTAHQTWFSIAEAYLQVGKIIEDVDSCEKALHFYRKALDIQTSALYIFKYAHALAFLAEMDEDRDLLDQAIAYYEYGISKQINLLFTHPEWLFGYACALSLLGDDEEEELPLHKALELLNKILLVDPDFPHINYQIAMVHSQLGELTEDNYQFQKALDHFQIALDKDGENDQLMIDLSCMLLNYAENQTHASESETFYQLAEQYLIKAALLGNEQAYYYLSCLHSLKENLKQSLFFLKKACDAQALPLLEEILEDAWLEELRSTSEFQDFLTLFEQKNSEY